MTVGYRISELRIENFRGVSELTLQFPICAPTYLIGGNNSGKSTVLNAIALALRGGGFHTFEPDLFDFYCDDSGRHATQFKIDLAFQANNDGTLPAVQGVGNPKYVHAIRVAARTEKNGRLVHRHQLLDETQEAIVLSSRTALKGATKEEFAGHGLGWSQHYSRPDDLREHQPEVWLLSAANLERALYHWKTGPLSRLSELLTRRFLEEEWQFVFGGKSRPMPQTMKAAHEFFRMAVQEFPFWKNDLKPKLQDALSGYLGRSAGFDLQPDIHDLEAWMTAQLALSFAADSGGVVTPLDRMGDGWQALVRLAALDVLKDYPDEFRRNVVLLIEEPETYLHPHLRRKLRVVLQRLSKNGWLVVCATHSPEFIRLDSDASVHRLWRAGTAMVQGSLLSADVPQPVRFQEKLDEHGTHEFLFSNKAIFVEGKDDSYAVKLGLLKLDADLDGRGVSVVSVGGIENIPDYARMANLLRIPWCAITDEDIERDGTIKAKTAAVRKKLDRQKTDVDYSLVWARSLEHTLSKSTGKAKPEWQECELAPLSVEQLTERRPEFMKMIATINTWIASIGTSAPDEPATGTGKAGVQETASAAPKSGG